MGRISTHVLDASIGKPAAGVTIEFFTQTGSGWQLLKTVRTNHDGRTDEPLLAGADFRTGVYRLEFHVGDYFRARGVALGEPAFIDRVPLQFGVGEAQGHYHVPLLCTPWSYSTYRGS